MPGGGRPSQHDVRVAESRRKRPSYRVSGVLSYLGFNLYRFTLKLLQAESIKPFSKSLLGLDDKLLKVDGFDLLSVPPVL